MVAQGLDVTKEDPTILAPGYLVLNPLIAQQALLGQLQTSPAIFLTLTSGSEQCVTRLNDIPFS